MIFYILFCFLLLYFYVFLLEFICNKILLINKNMDFKCPLLYKNMFYKKYTKFFCPFINRTSKNRFSYASKLPLEPRRHKNQRFYGCNRLEFEENDGKIESKIFAIYLSAVFTSKFLLFGSLKRLFKERLIIIYITYLLSLQRYMFFLITQI